MHRGGPQPCMVLLEQTMEYIFISAFLAFLSACFFL